MIWHDNRLLGTTPPIAPNTYHVDATTDLDHALGWIAFFARSQGGLDELIVMCHGFESNFNLSNQTCTTKQVGGFGLQICKQGINLGNVGKLRAWNPVDASGTATLLIKKVTIYACAAADTGAGNAGTWGDGTRFMGEFAMNSGAFVVAGRDAQVYSYGTGTVNPAPIDFGDWEGPVFLFDPKTGAGSPFQPGPMAYGCRPAHRPVP
jgi:hypothetical protein